VLEQGDLLYFPRGCIHQAVSEADEHSLHCTVSCGSRNSWADYMEALVPAALQSVIGSNLGMRQGLPRDFHRYMGVMNQPEEDDEDDEHEDDDEEDDEVPDEGDEEGMARQLRAMQASADPKKRKKALLRERGAFSRKAALLTQAVMAECLQSLDGVADRSCREFMMDRLPPMLLQEEQEKRCSAPPPHLDTAEFPTDPEEVAALLPCGLGETPAAAVTIKSEVRLARRGIARVVLDEGVLVLHHSTWQSLTIPRTDYCRCHGPC
jgi:lysine-specific demethylase/histidyl-hydroxylase NO66